MYTLYVTDGILWSTTGEHKVEKPTVWQSLQALQGLPFFYGKAGKMEIWDLYDESRRPLGRTARRDEPLQPGEYHVVVGIWVFDGKGHILLTRRDASKRYMPGKWENTGGHVVSGEDSRAAAARELWEETGIQAVLRN